MKHIAKGDEPSFWKAYVKKHPRENYLENMNKKEKQVVVQHLREYMLKEQFGICCYCCGSLEYENSHIEHIKPRDSYPKLSMAYSNMLVSCKESEHCGMKKGNKFDEEKFVSPLDMKCESNFSYEPDGTIIGETDSGVYTVELLNLNTYGLKAARRALFEECCDMARDDKRLIEEYYIKIQNGKLPRFVDMVAFFYNRGDFDYLD